MSDIQSEKRIHDILQLIHNEVLSSCGDGDAIWYTTYSTLEEILLVLVKFNESQDNYWTIDSSRPSVIYASNYQEDFIITDSEKIWNERPSWQQMSLKC